MHTIDVLKKDTIVDRDVSRRMETTLHKADRGCRCFASK